MAKKTRKIFVELRKDGKVKRVSKEDFMCLHQQGLIRDFKPNAHSKVGTQMSTCFKKKSYASLQEAENFSDFILRRYGDSQRPYHCPHCRRYHLTTNHP